MKKIQKILTVFLILIPTIFTSCSKNKWQTSFEESKKISAKNHKDIFMVISGGADSSSNFKKDVLDSKEFLNEASKNLTLFFINLSADGLTGFSQEQLSKVYEETSKIIMDYNITDELTMLRLSPEGYCLAEFPYAEKYSSPLALLEDLKASDEKISLMKNKISEIKKTDGIDKAKAIDDFFEMTNEKYKTLVLPLCHEIPNLDSANTTGLLGKYELLIAYDKANSMLTKDTVDQTANLFVSIAENGHLDRSQKFEAYFTAAYLYSLVGSTDFDRMCDLLEKAYNSNPNDDHASEATELMETIKNIKTIYENSAEESDTEKQSEEN